MIFRNALVIAGVAAAVAVAGCSSSSSSSSSSSAGASAAASSSGSSAPASPSATATGSGPVDVLYAGSLVNFMQKVFGPGFQSSTGYSITGYSAGSKALATDIKGKVYQGDVFISASPKVNASLEGAKNGNWVSWYATFATAPLVIGYNPSSKFANDLKTKPWYQVITEPGFKLGFTDPATDPKGELVAEALTDTAKAKKLPALTAIENNKGDVFPEETLVGRLQAGQLDAAFFYTSESTPANIATVPVTGEDLKATYTVTILANASHEAAAESFISYLLGSAGMANLTSAGFKLVTPVKVTGTGVPPSLSSVLP
jgi:molybdate/tungstate transport system substrate-binding protein